MGLARGEIFVLKEGGGFVVLVGGRRPRQTDLSLYWTDSMNNTFICGQVNDMAREML